MCRFRRAEAYGNVKWESNEDRKLAVVARGKFHIADDVFYNSITEIYNICGGRRTGPDKGSMLTIWPF